MIYCCRTNLLEKEIQALNVMLFLVKCCAFDKDNNLWASELLFFFISLDLVIFWFPNHRWQCLFTTSISSLLQNSLHKVMQSHYSNSKSQNLLSSWLWSSGRQDRDRSKTPMWCWAVLATPTLELKCKCVYS